MGSGLVERPCRTSLRVDLDDQSLLHDGLLLQWREPTEVVAATLVKIVELHKVLKLTGDLNV